MRYVLHIYTTDVFCQRSNSHVEGRAFLANYECVSMKTSMKPRRMLHVYVYGIHLLVPSRESIIQENHFKF